MSTRAEIQPKPRWRRRLQRGTLAALCALALATLLSFAGRTHWLVELLSHWVAVYALAAILLAPLALALRPRWWWGALLGFCLVANVGRVAPDYWPRDVAIDPDAPRVSLLLANVQRVNPERAALAAQVAAHSPDVVALVEIDQSWLDDLAEHGVDYPHRVAMPNALNLGLAVYSRYPIASVERMDLDGEFELPGAPERADAAWCVELVLDVDGRALRLSVVHAYPPVSGALSALRDAVLLEVAERAGGDEIPGVIAGDFNATPWSPIFADVVDRSGYLDARRGFGLQATWGPLIPTLPIDHVLHSPDLAVSSHAVLPEIGSDHRPVLVEFGWAAE